MNEEKFQKKYGVETNYLMDGDWQIIVETHADMLRVIEMLINDNIPLKCSFGVLYVPGPYITQEEGV
jgi:hypothetical protein